MAWTVADTRYTLFALECAVCVVAVALLLQACGFLSGGAGASGRRRAASMYAGLGKLSVRARRRRRSWKATTIVPLVLSAAAAAASASSAVQFSAEAPTGDGALPAELAGWVETCAWVAAGFALWARVVHQAPGSCGLPLLWCVALGAHIYGMVVGLRGEAGDGGDRPRSEVLAWVRLCVNAALVLFGCCCCFIGTGVHEPLGPVEDEGDEELGDAGSATPLVNGGRGLPAFGVAATAAAAAASTRATARASAGLDFKSRVDAGLAPAEVSSFYDAFGMMQDYERLYTDKATSHLRLHAGLGSARHVLEIGCGTGALAAKMLDADLPDRSTYTGIDISARMVEITTRRVLPWGPRARALHTDGNPALPEIEAGSIDRVVSCYAFDAMSDAYIGELLEGIARALSPAGQLCVASLTYGGTPFAAGMTSAWVSAYRCSPRALGGCRPLEVTKLLAAHGWRVLHSSTTTQFALTSEMVIAAPPHSAAPAPGPNPIGVDM